ncbi:MAG: hypothetical protein ABI542_11165 [Gemmatimonadota bacterium]
MRPLWVALALTLAAACGGTGPSDGGPELSGSIFFARSASGDSLATSPWQLNFGSPERLIPVDLSRYEMDSVRRSLILGDQNIDVSRDGRFLYLSAFRKILRVNLPGGGVPEELGVVGIATNPQVSPDGSRIVFERPVGGFELGMMNTDGSGARIFFQAPIDLIEYYGEPIWLGNDRILLPVLTPMAGGSPTRVLEFAAPDWQEGEYVPLRNALSHTLDVLAASPDGTRLFLAECRPDCRILEYSPGGPYGAVLFDVDDSVGGRFVVSPDGNYLLFSGDDLAIFDLRTRRKVKTIPGGLTSTGFNREEYAVSWTEKSP